MNGGVAAGAATGGVMALPLLPWLLREGVAGAAVNHKSTLAVMGFVRRLRRGEWPSVGESAGVGLGLTGVEAEFPIGVDAHRAILLKPLHMLISFRQSCLLCKMTPVKSEGEASPPSITVHVSIIGPAFAECLKDSSTPVKTMSQKFITGLDARRLSKFAEYRGCGVAAMRAKTMKKNQQVANS
uniref:Uncharacterized protein n=1 Tax=Populus alba TaxID=43335 RepID=A0A4U5R4G3_POPAL|nr:hypothetical protein D5086_0000009250 [Populus alba]